MKIKIIKEVISEAIDSDYLKQQGVTLGKKLGSGMFGVVYEIAADLGDGTKQYALKYVDRASPGYARERKNYQAIKKFVEFGKDTQDVEATKLAKILPVIYSVAEHRDGLYIIMEKLMPLSPEESKLFMSEVSGLAYYYSMKGQASRGEQLIDYIIDRDGNVGVTFDGAMATAVIKAVLRAPEYAHLKKDLQKYSDAVMRGGKSQDTKKVMDMWSDSMVFDDVKFVAISELYKLNSKFKKFLDGVSSILINEYQSEGGASLESDKDFVGMLMGAIFDIVFSQKYPMKYSPDPDYESPYETGHGQSSEIWDVDVDANPKLEEQKEKYGKPGVAKNIPKKKLTKTSPQKYPFDAIISAIRRLGRDWNIEAKDMHQANVMKRTNGQFVIADIGLFNTKILQSFKSGIFETKRKIKVKII